MEKEGVLCLCYENLAITAKQFLNFICRNKNRVKICLPVKAKKSLAFSCNNRIFLAFKKIMVFLLTRPIF